MDSQNGGRAGGNPGRWAGCGGRAGCAGVLRGRPGIHHQAPRLGQQEHHGCHVSDRSNWPPARPRVLKHARYTDSLDTRRFRDPAVSPGGKYVISSTTGPDVSVVYSVRRAVATGKQVIARKTALFGRDRTAWTRHGDRVAFWGVPTSDIENVRVYVCDAGAATVATEGPLSNVAVTGLAWSPDDSLLAYATSAPGAAVDRGHLWTIAPGASATPTDMGAGGLPVWVP